MSGWLNFYKSASECAKLHRIWHSPRPRYGTRILLYSANNIATPKLLEKLTTSRLRDHLTDNLALADNQYGFRRGRSTLDALGRLKSICKTATAGHAFHHKLVGMLTLDVRNAFNSAPWRVILDAATAKDVPVAILNRINDYLSERKIEVASPSGNVNFVKNMSCGVPQGSVLGPDLWNLMYDNLLRTEMPNGVELIAFADDVAVVSTASAAYLLEDNYWN